MITYNYQTEFVVENEEQTSQWIAQVMEAEGFREGDISYVFCDDEFLLKLNIEFLDHDTLTDIISFDYTIGKQIHGEIYISVERVQENAKDFGVDFQSELRRVMVHGILHYCGYKDKSKADQATMRVKENYYTERFS